MFSNYTLRDLTTPDRDILRDNKFTRTAEHVSLDEMMFDFVDIGDVQFQSEYESRNNSDDAGYSPQSNEEQLWDIFNNNILVEESNSDYDINSLQEFLEHYQYENKSDSPLCEICEETDLININVIHSSTNVDANGVDLDPFSDPGNTFKSSEIRSLHFLDENGEKIEAMFLDSDQYSSGSIPLNQSENYEFHEIESNCKMASVNGHYDTGEHCDMVNISNIEQFTLVNPSNIKENQETVAKNYEKIRKSRKQTLKILTHSDIKFYEITESALNEKDIKSRDVLMQAGKNRKISPKKSSNSKEKYTPRRRSMRLKAKGFAK